MNQFPCSVCQEAGHKSSHCPELSAPLKQGFYAPPAGARGHSDDEDEKLKLEFIRQGLKAQWRILAIQSVLKKPSI